MDFETPKDCKEAGCRVDSVKADGEPGFWIQHNNTSTRHTKPEEAAAWVQERHTDEHTPVVTVAADGSGDFLTVQEAIDAGNVAEKIASRDDVTGVLA